MLIVVYIITLITQCLGVGNVDLGQCQMALTCDHGNLPNIQQTGTLQQTGIPGKRGPPGPQGLAGAKGALGPPGPFGQKGSSGPPGSQGLTGPQGNDGQPGPFGQKGSPGPPGRQGSTGSKGEVGQKGSSGPPGPQGLTGPQGYKGSSGLPGPQGRGLPGPKGSSGTRGLTGPQGPRGSSCDVADELEIMKTKLTETISQMNETNIRLNETNIQLNQTIINLYAQLNDITSQFDETNRQVNQTIRNLYEQLNRGWTVIQRRYDGSVDFYKNWYAYKHGFGDPRGEFWLGLEDIHRLTKRGNYMLRIELEDRQGDVGFAEYSTFVVGSEATNYSLEISGYEGNISDSMVAHHNLNGMMFTTYDQDHDKYSGNCAELLHSGWWHKNCARSNLNGDYSVEVGYEGAIAWYQWKNNWKSMRSTKMMIRPKV